MTPRPDLVPAATRELRAREKHWPAEVAAERMSAADADADIAAWRAIAALLATGAVETALPWSVLIGAVQLAIDRQIARAWSATGYAATPEAEARCAAVADIRTVLRRAAWQVGQCLGSIAA